MALSSLEVKDGIKDIGANQLSLTVAKHLRLRTRESRAGRWFQRFGARAGAKTSDINK